jgi:radical SAM protein with 4Fe4S-binding SPASM domain
MEFINLSKYFEIVNPKILPFNQLRGMKPLLVTQELNIVNDDENINYANSLASQGIIVAPIRRIPPFEKYLNREDFPRRVLFEMTSRCNFLCRMCPQQDLKRPKMDVSYEVYKRVIDEIDNFGIEGLWTYQFGEPLLHPKFNEITNYISSKNNLGVIWVSTNGEYLNEEKINCILDSKIDYVNYSVNSVTEETYSTVVLTPNKFRTITQNLEKLFKIRNSSKTHKNTKPFIRCQMIEQETTKHEIDDFIKKYYVNADIVSINMLEHINIKNNSFGFEQRNRKPLKSCMRVQRNDCFIWSNGDVTLCDAAYNGEIYLGNINNQSLYDIWNGDIRKKIKKLNTEGGMSEIEFCRNCTDYDL